MTVHAGNGRRARVAVASGRLSRRGFFKNLGRGIALLAGGSAVTAGVTALMRERNFRKRLSRDFKVNPARALQAIAPKLTSQQVREVLRISEVVSERHSTRVEPDRILMALVSNFGSEQAVKASIQGSSGERRKRLERVLTTLEEVDKSKALGPSFWSNLGYRNGEPTSAVETLRARLKASIDYRE